MDSRADIARVRELYLSTMARILTNTIYEDGDLRPNRGGPFEERRRATGRDWPEKAFTMIGTHRLTNLRQLAAAAIEANVPGDFIEAGIWRGGACIMLRAVLEAYADKDRTVFCADSFQGIPPSNPEEYPSDAGRQWHKDLFPQLAISQEAVEEAFRKFGLLDSQVRFLAGWFKDTLPTVKNRQFALIRLDGDLYESTIQSLDNLYPALSPGGYVIIDDFSLPNCRAAVEDYRRQHEVEVQIEKIDFTGVWWQKPAG